MNKIFTFEEVQKDIYDSEYKRAALYDKHGDNLVPWNSKSTPLKKRLTEIRGRLQSAATPDGIYSLRAKHYGQKAVESIYYVQKGDTLADIELEKIDKVEIIHQEQPREIDYQKSGFVSMDTHNSLYKAKIELEYKVKELEATIDRLNDELDDLEANPPKSGGLLSENTQTFLSSTLEQVAPIIDKMLEQRDMNLKLKALELSNGQQVAPQQPAPQQRPQEQQQMNDDDQGEEVSEQEEVYIQAMENLKASHPEIYQAAIDKLNDHYQQDTQA